MPPPATSHLLELIPHPACTTAADIRVFANCERRGDSLVLDYKINGNLDALSIPAPGPSDRQDGLWQQTCLEAFIREEAQSAYREYNFSPSGAWACYQFSKYRGSPQSPDCPTLRIERRASNGHLQISVQIPAPSAKILHIGLSAVLEDRQGGLSYWALDHPADKPDFHDPRSFVLELDNQ